MKKKLLSFVLALILIIGTFSFIFSSCDKNTDENSESSEETSSQATTSSEESSSENVESQESDEPIYVLEGTSGIVDVEWSFGIVCSSKNSLFQDELSTIIPQYSYSNVITCPKAGTKISFTDDKAPFTSMGAYVFSSWHMKDGKWLLNTDSINYMGSSSNESWIATPTDDSVVYTYITSYDNENIRICYDSGHTSTNTPEFPTVTFEVTGEKGTYKQQLEYEASTTVPQAEKDYWFDVFKNVTQMNIIGDSYFGSDNPGKQYVWPQLLANKYDFKLDNKGVSGSTMSNYVTTNNPMVDRYDKMPDNNPQIVLLQGGRNDRNQHVPIGENTDTDTKTFKGAVNYLITKIQEKYPDAFLVCITPWKINTDRDRNNLGKNTYDYAVAMVEVCEYRNVVCFNAADTELSKVYMESGDFRAAYCVASGDISHLNIKGFEYVMPKFEKFIAEEYEKFLAEKQSQ